MGREREGGKERKGKRKCGRGRAPAQGTLNGRRGERDRWGGCKDRAGEI
jgi:hypothetical protein